MKDIQTIRAAIENAEVKESEIDRLKDCLRDVLKAICQKIMGLWIQYGLERKVLLEAL